MKRFFIKNASLLLPCGLQTGSIEFDSTITALRRSNDSCAPDYECETLDAHGGFVVPGLFDIHTHGAYGADFSDADFSDRNVLNDIHECSIHECSIHECSNYKCNEFDVDSFPLNSPLFRLSRYYLSQGVTSFLATTMTLCAEELFAAMHSIDAFCRMRDEFIKRTPNKLHHLAGAKCIGINLEGPFLSSSKRGSQAECNLLAPDAALFHQLNAASGGRINMRNMGSSGSKCGNCRVVVVSFGISPSDAFFAASYAPFASVFGDSVPFGLECGRAADLAVFDANLNLKAVFMDGERML